MTTQTAEKRKLGPTDCLTPVFRMSYPALLEPKQIDPQKPDLTYGVEMLFRVAETPESKKNGEEVVSIQPLKDAAMAAVNEKWGSDPTKWPLDLKEKLAKLFKRGDSPSAKDKAGYGPGVIYVRANRKAEFDKPVVVDQLVAPVTDKNLVYGGAYARAKIHAYAWSHKTGGNGVSFTLDMLQLVRDGEPFGNRRNAADTFEAIKPPQAAAAAGQDAPATQKEATDLFAEL